MPKYDLRIVFLGQKFQVTKERLTSHIFTY